MADLPSYIELPQFVYFLTVDAEWPVTVIGGKDDAATAERIEQLVHRDPQIRVWRGRIAEVREVELVPSRMVPPTLRVKGEIDG